MDQFIVKIRVSKSGKPDTFMTANRSVPSTSIAAVLNRLTADLDKMTPIEDDKNA